ncbi:CDK5 regulatory subunit-associated protein 2 isoform X2 [Paramormyrops kingsleyae]|uniref:CDK5 regulatory subunit-associated protein 2 isoform X2 n=2 Tax=Paramormyrops kingsleyae TaxID=1676925 RepID=UPI003B96F529
MDSVVGEDPTLPIDMNGSTGLSRLDEMADDGHLPVDSMAELVFPGERVSPVKAHTMKDYENQITNLKKENFNLKLRIYFMEERAQQKYDSAEDVYKTNIELKVEVESLKRELSEKQELLVSASKAVENLAGKESGDILRLKEQARREAERLRDTFNKKLQQLEESLKAAEEEAEKMAAVAEQEKVRNIDMEKQILAFSLSSTFTPVSTQDAHHVLQEKDGIIEQLKLSLKNRDAEVAQLQKAIAGEGRESQPASVHMRDLTEAIAQKDKELETLKEELGREKVKNERDLQVSLKTFVEKQNDIAKMEALTKEITDDLNSSRATIKNLTKTLEDGENENKILHGKLEESEEVLASEKKNAVKRDKTIQGLSLLLKQKDKEMEELCHEIEDRDAALAKAREAAHKAQIQKYQGAEEHQNLLMDKQAELEKLQLEHHGKVLEAQKLQRALRLREKDVGDMQQAKEQLEQELEELQQLKKKGDKAVNDLQNQLKKLKGELGERERAQEQHYQSLLNESQRALQGHELTIQRLTCSLSDKEHQLQEYMNMIKDQEQRRSPGGGGDMLTKLRERLREKEGALQQALDEKFAAIEEKDNEIHQLHLSLREKERDLERLNNLLSHNEETINSFDSVIKEKDVELQHLANSFKDQQRAKQEMEENLSRTLREKDAIISQLQQALEGKSKDLDEMNRALLSKTQSGAVSEQLGQQQKAAEALLAEVMKDRERLVSDNESAVEGLLKTISSKDQLLKDSAEHYKRLLAERAQEVRDLKEQLAEKQQQLCEAEKQSSAIAHAKCLVTAELRGLLAEKDTVINKLVESGQEREKFLTELRLTEVTVPQVVELKRTVQVLQERLHEEEAVLLKKNEDSEPGKIELMKSAVTLKKELAQQTEALNKALKKNSELQVQLAELRSTLADLESRSEAQAANIESLTAVLQTKDEIIQDLHKHLRKPRDYEVSDLQARAAEPKEERPLPGLPQRERTIIGGNSQQEATPALSSVLSEHKALNRALKAEQQLYSSLVRTVKESDSAQRLHALQMELAAVQLLRQQLEEGVQNNEELRRDLETELQRAKQREGSESQAEPVDPKELESVRQQLEDAQRWNVSLQARLGAIQSRGGGVGGTSDTADTFSFLADQTSYLSICVEDKLDEELGHLSVPELRQMILELRDYIKRLQASNEDHHKKASLLSRADAKPDEKEDEDVSQLAYENKHLEKNLDGVARISKTSTLSKEHRQAAWDPSSDEHGQSSDGDGSKEGSVAEHQSSGVSQAQSKGGQLNNAAKSKRDRHQEGLSRDVELLSLLKERRLSSVTQLREEILRLQAENAALRGLLKKEQSEESKESADGSGESDSKRDLQKMVEKMKSEAVSQRKIIKVLKDQLELNSATEGVATFNPDLIVNMAREIERLKAELGSSKRRAGSLQKEAHQKVSQPVISNSKEATVSPAQHKALRPAAGKSRLPVPIRHDKVVLKRPAGSQATDIELQSLTEEVLEMEKKGLGQPESWASEQEESTLRPDCPGSAEDIQKVGGFTAKQMTGTELLSELELLHYECQEKERVIGQLQEKAAKCEELQATLLEKDELNREFVEALQAAESTIEYLTACNMDKEGKNDHVLQSDPHSHYWELQRMLQEKEALNKQLLDCLHVAESALASLSAFPAGRASADTQIRCSDPQGLLHKLENVLQQIGVSVDQSKPGAVDPQDSASDLQRQIDELQEALWERDRRNAELQDRLAASGRVAIPGRTSSGTTEQDLLDSDSATYRQLTDVKKLSEQQQREAQGGQIKMDKCSKCGTQNQHIEKPSKHHEKQDQIIRQLAECLFTAGSALASLNACYTQGNSTEKPVSKESLQQELQRLQKVFQDKAEWQEHYLEYCTQKLRTAYSEGHHMDLYQNISSLQQALTGSAQVISDLRKALEKLKTQNKQYQNELRIGKSSPKSTDLPEKLENLQKALGERERTCKELEEKLAAAQEIIAMQKSIQEKQVGNQKAMALGQDDKEVQVDLQDLGYETSGKSENEMDREENSSSGTVDNDQDVHHTRGTSIPSLLGQIHGNFSSTENLNTSSSTSYPSSPTLSSPKFSLKNLQMFEDYGVTDNPEHLKQQVLELKGQLETHQRVSQHLQSLLHRTSQSSDLLAFVSDYTAFEKHSQELTKEERHSIGYEEDLSSEGTILSQDEDEKQMMEHITNLSTELEKERNRNKNLAEQLQQIQFRSRSASPARMDSLVQSQARELSQLRQQIKESRELGALQRLQLEELGRAFEELLQAGDVDHHTGDVVREQLDKSLTVLEKLEERLENGDKHLDNEDRAVLDLAQREPPCLSRDGFDSSLRSQLEGEREQLQQQMRYLVQQNQNLAEVTKEQLDLLSRELHEKKHQIQDLQSQLRGRSPSSHHSSAPELSTRGSPSDRPPPCGDGPPYGDGPPDGSGSGSGSIPLQTHGVSHLLQGLAATSTASVSAVDSAVRHHDNVASAASRKHIRPGGGVELETHLHGLRRENSRLLEQLRSSEQLNETLRSELDLHCSILAQKDEVQPEPCPLKRTPDVTERAAEPDASRVQAAAMSPELLAEHLQEVRTLRLRLEETIRTNDRLRDQLERRLAEAERDPAATNIFIHGAEEQSQLASEIRFLRSQNQALKEQLSTAARDKQRESEKLRESLARRTARLEVLRSELEEQRRENVRTQSRLTGTAEENRRLQESVQRGRDEIHRIQAEMSVQRQQLTDSQHLLKSLRMELQVSQQTRTAADRQRDPSQEAPTPGAGSLDLNELLSEIRHLRLQLERSIHTNNALRQKLEEQLLRGSTQQDASPSTININYLLSAESRPPCRGRGGDESSAQDVGDLNLPSVRVSSDILYDIGGEVRRSSGRMSQSSGSSADSTSTKPARLVPGHHLWANKNGRHVFGLIEDHNALRKQISEGRKLIVRMEQHLQECLQALSKQDSKSTVLDQQLLKGFSTNINTMQQVLEEAARLLRLLWRVSIPTCSCAGGCQGIQDEALKNEIARLKAKLSEQDRLLLGAVKRLRNTNQLKEGMEKVIIEQLSLTHDVLKKARGNLETNYCARFGLKGLPGPTKGGPGQWVELPQMQGVWQCLSLSFCKTLQFSS